MQFALDAVCICFKFALQSLTVCLTQCVLSFAIRLTACLTVCPNLRCHLSPTAWRQPEDKCMSTCWVQPEDSLKTAWRQMYVHMFWSCFLSPSQNSCTIALVHSLFRKFCHRFFPSGLRSCKSLFLPWGHIRQSTRQYNTACKTNIHPTRQYKTVYKTNCTPYNKTPKRWKICP